MATAAVISLLFITVLAPALAQVVVQTHLGEVHGQTVATHYGINVNTWHGIPFAASTAGPLRWTVSAHYDVIDMNKKAYTHTGHLRVFCSVLIQVNKILNHPHLQSL